MGINAEDDEQGQCWLRRLDKATTGTGVRDSSGGWPAPKSLRETDYAELRARAGALSGAARVQAVCVEGEGEGGRAGERQVLETGDMSRSDLASMTVRVFTCTPP